MAYLKYSLLLYLCIFNIFTAYSLQFNEEKLKFYREKVSKMFYHAYEGYTSKAYPYDELRPISCDGMDSWGSCALTLIDALDTLAIMGNYTEFRRVANQVIETQDFNSNMNVSVFETNIRVVGGLISAHLLSKKAGMDVGPEWPCSGPLLSLAEQVAKKLLPAFDSSTGMPYGTVNLMTGVPIGETPVTCTAGIGTYIIEFAALSRLTNDPIYERTAMKALWALWKKRSPIGLVGNHIDVQAGKWVALDSGIGAGVDSYFEYLVKGSIMLQNPLLLKMFKSYYQHINKYIKREDWHLWVSMTSGQVSMPIFQSLEAFWPGVLSLVGEIDDALKILYTYHKVWKQYGFIPEFYDIPHKQMNSKRKGYPLRPELIESIMYLYQATKDQRLLEMGVDILESIEHSAKTSCGYATIKNVQSHAIEDRMESFFLAETTKYLYLLFDPDHFLHNKGCCQELLPNGCNLSSGSFIFNTEAHPIDLGALDCCHSPFHPSQDILSSLIKKPGFSPKYSIPEDDLMLDILHDEKDEDSQATEKETVVEIDSEDFLLKSTEDTLANISTDNQSEDIPPVITTPDVEEFLHLKGNNHSSSWYQYLICPALPYLARLSLMGEMFTTAD